MANLIGYEGGRDRCAAYGQRENCLVHHGIEGQRWRIRRFQNYDGTLTELGKLRYRKNKSGLQKTGEAIRKRIAGASSLRKKEKAISDREKAAREKEREINAREKALRDAEKKKAEQDRIDEENRKKAAAEEEARKKAAENQQKNGDKNGAGNQQKDADKNGAGSQQNAEENKPKEMTAAEKKAFEAAEAKRKSNPKTMTNAELKAAIDHMKLVKEYKQLNSELNPSMKKDILSRTKKLLLDTAFDIAKGVIKNNVSSKLGINISGGGQNNNNNNQSKNYSVSGKNKDDGNPNNNKFKKKK